MVETVSCKISNLAHMLQRDVNSYSGSMPLAIVHLDILAVTHCGRHWVQNIRSLVSKITMYFKACVRHAYARGYCGVTNEGLTTS